MEEISIISMLFTAMLALGCLFLILAPLFQWNSYFTVKTGSTFKLNEKEVLLSTLNEIEFEHKMDKLSDKDYLELKKQYEIQIVKVMKAESRMENTLEDSDLLEEVEKEIQQAMLQHKKNKGGS